VSYEFPPPKQLLNARFTFMKLGMPLWSSGQGSWLQNQRFWVRFQALQIFCIAVGLERGPFSLMKINEELFERKGSGSGLENRD
jgi:hypothetical protein